MPPRQLRKELTTTTPTTPDSAICPGRPRQRSTSDLAGPVPHEEPPAATGGHRGGVVQQDRQVIRCGDRLMTLRDLAGHGPSDVTGCRSACERRRRPGRLGASAGTGRRCPGATRGLTPGGPIDDGGPAVVPVEGQLSGAGHSFRGRGSRRSVACSCPSTTWVSGFDSSTCRLNSRRRPHGGSTRSVPSSSHHTATIFAI